MHRYAWIVAQVVGALLVIKLCLLVWWTTGERPVSITQSDRELLLLNVWTGRRIPEYLPQVIAQIESNPMLKMLIIATPESGSICTKQGQADLILRTHSNIRVRCIPQDELYTLLTNGMCDVWDCSAEESISVSATITSLLQNEPYRMNDLKPVYISAFADLIRDTFPLSSFSHWIRLDLDVMLGGILRNLPLDKLDYDVVSFPPRLNADAREAIVRGYFAIFKLCPRLDTLWVRMSKFASPQAFVDAAQRPTFKSIDEGLFSKTVLEATDISFTLLPGRVFLDDEARRGSKFVVRGDRPDILLLHDEPDTHELEEAALRSQALHTDRHITPSRIQLPKRDVVDRGAVQLTTNCPMYDWIPAEDWLCVDGSATEGDGHGHGTDGPILARDEAHGLSLYRAPGSTEIRLAELPDPGALSLDLSRGSDLGSGTEATVRQVLALHVMDSKKPPIDQALFFGSSGHVLAHDEKMEVYHDRRLGQYASRFFHRLDGDWHRFSPP